MADTITANQNGILFGGGQHGIVSNNIVQRTGYGLTDEILLCMFVMLCYYAVYVNAKVACCRKEASVPLSNNIVRCTGYGLTDDFDHVIVLQGWHTMLLFCTC